MPDDATLLLLRAAAAGDEAAVEQALAVDDVDINAVDTTLGLTPLGHAIARGSAQVTRLLVAAGADTRSVGRGDYGSALLWAIHHRRVDVVDVLVAAKVDLNAVNMDAESPLMIACRRNAPDMVKTLLRAGADAYYIKPKSRECALSIAAMIGFGDVVATLLEVEHRQHQITTTWDFPRALTCAIKAGHAGVTQQLLDAGARLGRVILHKGVPPLIHAVQHSHVTLVRVLLNAGVDVNQRYFGDSALLVSAQLDCPAITDMLLDVDGVQIDCVDLDGNTALLCAVSQGASDLVLRLINMGANVHHVNNAGETALILASRGDNTQLVETFLALGVAVDAQTTRGFTALLCASRLGTARIVETLLSTGIVQVNHAANNGDSALTLAARNGQTRTVEVLLAHGADVDHRGENGATALGMASAKGHIEVAAALLAVGANVRTTDRQGFSAYLRAVERNKLRVLEMLSASCVDVNGINHAGRSAMKIARRRRHHSVTAWLQSHTAADTER